MATYIVYTIAVLLLLNIEAATGSCFESVGGEFNYMYWFEEIPDCPEKMKTQFVFYTANGTVSVEALTQDHFNFTKIDFNKRSDTKIIVHGWGENITREWIQDLKLDFQKQGNYNIIAVDWSVGASYWYYYQSVANTRVVGRQIALLVKNLVRAYSIRADTVHIIGFSLGAHAAGNAGDYAKQLAIGTIGRLTGLDPARSWFQGAHDSYCLDRNDALTVDVLHTDFRASIAFGIGRPIGTFDLFFNNADESEQPNCVYDGIILKLYESFFGEESCSHHRAVELFVQSVGEKCFFTGTPCSPKDRCGGTSTFCKNCTDIQLGYDHMKGTPGSYLVRTDEETPFCFKV